MFDILPGLCESVQLKCSGDVDQFVSEIGLKSRQERNMILEDLKKLHTQLIAFAISGTHIQYSMLSLIL